MLLLLASLAHGHTFDLGAGTDFPVSVGAAAAYEAPSRLRAELSAGVLPGPYVDTINAAMTALDVYGDTTAQLIDVLLQGAVVVHAQVGYRPLAARGLTVAAGYQYVGLAGDTTDLGLYAEAGLPEDAVEEAQDDLGDLDAYVAPHMVTAEVGWQWVGVVRPPVVVRASLAFAYTVSASATVTADGEPRGRAAEQAHEAVKRGAETYLEDVFEQWVHLPMLGVTVAYRL